MTEEQFKKLEEQYSKQVVDATRQLQILNARLECLRKAKQEFGIENLTDNGGVVVVLGDLLEEVANSYNTDLKNVTISGGLAHTDVKDSKNKSFGKITIVLKGEIEQRLAKFDITADAKFTDGTKVEDVLASKSTRAKHKITDLCVEVNVAEDYMLDKSFKSAVKNTLAKTNVDSLTK